MAQTYTGGDALRIPGLDVNARAAFITRTYNHLLGAVLLFTALEILYFQIGWAQPMARAMLGVNWLLVLGAFVIVSWFASRVAHTSDSKETQYLALGGFVLAESIIFVPMLYIANAAAPGAIQSAATMTVVGFLGLTVVAFTTRKDFSFLGALLRWSFVLAILAIVGAVLFGFALGTWFSVAMVGLAGAAILYDTSNVIHHFPEDRYVGAALQLFASVALMFWYMLRLFMNRD